MTNITELAADLATDDETPREVEDRLRPIVESFAGDEGNLSDIEADHVINEYTALKGAEVYDHDGTLG